MFREATAKIRTLAASPFLTSLAINGALFLLFFLFFTPAYETTDDSFMMTIASGEYTGSPSEYLVFINTLFGFLLKFLYSAMPHLNWYPLLMYLLHFWAMVSILYVILSQRRSALYRFPAFSPLLKYTCSATCSSTTALLPEAAACAAL